MCFGIGWGFGSLCPGPGMVDFFMIPHIIIWIPCLAIGQLGWEMTEKAYINHTKETKESEEKFEPSTNKMHT